MFAARWKKIRHPSERFVFFAKKVVEFFPFHPTSKRFTPFCLGAGTHEKGGSPAGKGENGVWTECAVEGRRKRILGVEMRKKFTGQLHPCD